MGWGGEGRGVGGGEVEWSGAGVKVSSGLPVHFDRQFETCGRPKSPYIYTFSVHQNIYFPENPNLSIFYDFQG